MLRRLPTLEPLRYFPALLLLPLLPAAGGLAFARRGAPAHAPFVPDGAAVVADGAEDGDVPDSAVVEG